MRARAQRPRRRRPRMRSFLQLRGRRQRLLARARGLARCRRRDLELVLPPRSACPRRSRKKLARHAGVLPGAMYCAPCRPGAGAGVGRRRGGFLNVGAARSWPADTLGGMRGRPRSSIMPAWYLLMLSGPLWNGRCPVVQKPRYASSRAFTPASRASRCGNPGGGSWNDVARRGGRPAVATSSRPNCRPRQRRPPRCWRAPHHQPHVFLG